MAATLAAARTPTRAEAPTSASSFDRNKARRLMRQSRRSGRRRSGSSGILRRHDFSSEDFDLDSRSRRAPILGAWPLEANRVRKMQKPGKSGLSRVHACANGGSHMDGALLDRHGRFLDRFRHGRMRVAGAGEVFRGAAEFHQHGGFMRSFRRRRSPGYARRGRGRWRRRPAPSRSRRCGAWRGRGHWR